MTQTTLSKPRERTIIAGSDFAQVFIALRDGVGIPETIPDTIPDEWLEDLSGYDITVQLSTTLTGCAIVASTESGRGAVGIERRGAGHFFFNVPAHMSDRLSEGERRNDHRAQTQADRYRRKGRTDDNPGT